MVLMKAGAIRNICSTSVDNDSNSEKTLEFCKTIQSKMHCAVSGHTAAEIIYSRSDATKDNMGLTSWVGERVQKNDVTIAKLREFFPVARLREISEKRRRFLMFFNKRLKWYRIG